MKDPILDFASKHLRRNMDALDVGANRGLYTRAFASIARRVVAFEPNPAVAQILRSKVRKLSNVTVVEAAASDRIGEATFHVDARPGAGAVASSLTELKGLAAANMSRPIRVPVTTVDEQVRLADLRPGLIKIDVEGHEPDVVRGATQTIAAFRPALIFEIWETWWTRGYRELFEYLDPMYRMVRLATGEDAYAYYTAADRGQTADIGCIPRDSPAQGLVP